MYTIYLTMIIMNKDWHFVVSVQVRSNNLNIINLLLNANFHQVRFRAAVIELNAEIRNSAF